MTVVPPADSDLRRCHMYLYASVPDFILQNNLAAKKMLFARAGVKLNFKTPLAGVK
jgi:hypothetical protein